MVTELEMAKAAGKELKITLKDKSIVTGFACGFISAVNNTPEVPEIDLEHEDGSLSGYWLTDIDSIEVLDKTTT